MLLLTGLAMLAGLAGLDGRAGMPARACFFLQVWLGRQGLLARLAGPGRAACRFFQIALWVGATCCLVSKSVDLGDTTSFGSGRSLQRAASVGAIPPTSRWGPNMCQSVVSVLLL